MYEEKSDAEQQADAADDDVSDAEERVLAPEKRCSRQDHAFGSVERAHRIIYKTDVLSSSFSKRGRKLTVVDEQ